MISSRSITSTSRLKIAHSIDYLSLILSENHMEMDLVKVAGIQEFLMPRNVTGVQSFMGFVNFYWHFIQDFSHVAKPLHQCTKKGEAWHLR